MILRRRAYIRTLQPKTNQFSEKKIIHHGFPRKINAEALKKAGDEGWSKKRDNPERGRKLSRFNCASVHHCFLKKEIPPRGDGNGVP